MSMFPVRPEKVLAIEARLGIALPPGYLRLMANPRLLTQAGNRGERISLLSVW